MTTRKPEDIKTHPLFEGLFTINGELLAKIEQNMREENYDDSQPIILATWEGQEEPVCIDGHTRLKAAINGGIREIAVYPYEFETEEDAFEYAIRLQSNRRNLTDGDLLHCVERLHQQRSRGGDRRSEEAKSMPKSCGKKGGRSAAANQTAEMLNISSRKVEQALTVIKHGSPETKDAVLKNEMSINRAYQRTRKELKQAQAESSTENSKQQVTGEGQEPEEGDEDKEYSSVAPVLISLEHFGALHRLGGLVEDHVESAIELYLESLGKKDRDNPAETAKEEEDDEEEFFDPDTYVDELGLTSLI
jgi:hypothetical protein